VWLRNTEAQNGTDISPVYEKIIEEINCFD
jgi:hypothetical protein